jgi:putative membrane protein
MKTFVTALALSLLVGSALPLLADEKPNVATDNEFLINAMTCGTGEIRICEYAARSAHDPAVKEWAEKLVKEHKALNNTMAENARRLKVAVVAGQEKETRERLDALGKLKGNDFDREFLNQAIKGHEKAITGFEKEAKSGSDPDLKTFANNNLPTLKRHLEEARNLLAKLPK